jgi:hypothetical protein
MRPLLLATFLASAALAAGAEKTVRVPRDARALPAGAFEKLHALIRPQPGESKWATIPWLISLPEARRRAVKEDRPIFVWRAGGGEALGRA